MAAIEQTPQTTADNTITVTSPNVVPLTISKNDPGDSTGLTITNEGTGDGILINQDGDTPLHEGVYATASDAALRIVNSHNPGAALSIFTNPAQPPGDNGALVIIKVGPGTGGGAGHWNRPLLWIKLDRSHSSGAAASIRIDDPNPDIEFVDNDAVAPAGKFEIAVQSDALQLNGRDAANAQFDVILLATRPGNPDLPGFVGIGFQNNNRPYRPAGHLHVSNADTTTYPGIAGKPCLILDAASEPAQNIDIAQFRTGASRTVVGYVAETGRIGSTEGLTTKVKSGAADVTISDADFAAPPPDGTLALTYDTTSSAGTLWARLHDNWLKVSLT